MTPIQYLLGEIINDYTHMDSPDTVDNYTERFVIVSMNLGFTVNIILFKLLCIHCFEWRELWILTILHIRKYVRGRYGVSCLHIV